MLEEERLLHLPQLADFPDFASLVSLLSIINKRTEFNSQFPLLFVISWESNKTF
jgi:hypothetical protein